MCRREAPVRKAAMMSSRLWIWGDAISIILRWKSADNLAYHIEKNPPLFFPTWKVDGVMDWVVDGRNSMESGEILARECRY
jgi:hypothetical protein